MTIGASKFAPLLLALAAISPAAASAAVHNPQSDAALRKAVRDYVKYRVNDKTVKLGDLRIGCVQAAQVDAKRPCSGTFSLARAGETARYVLNKGSGTFRISPGAIEAHFSATATKRAPGLPSSFHWGAILQ